MSQLQVTPLSIEEIRKIANEDGSLWVINYTDQGRKRNRGNLHITFADESGVLTGLTVPNTWVPIDLSTYTSTKQLVKSHTFLETFRNSNLICISDAQAKNILSSPKAKEESEKIAEKYKISGSTLVNKDINIFADSSSASPSMETVNKVVEGADAVKSRLIEVITLFNDNKISESDAIEFVDQLEPQPTQEVIIELLSTINMTNSDFYKSLVERIG